MELHWVTSGPCDYSVLSNKTDKLSDSGTELVPLVGTDFGEFCTSILDS